MKTFMIDTHPTVATEWHTSLNTLVKEQITTGSDRKAFWQCLKVKSHTWEAVVKSRTLGSNGCPYCSGHRTDPARSLMHVNPFLAKEWHPTLNGNLTPLDVSPGSDKKVWWICIKNAAHVWKTHVKVRSKGHGCGICAGKIMDLEKSLEALNPALAAEWHPSLNGSLTPRDVTTGSTKKVYWQCQKHTAHVWRIGVDTRHTGNGCPYCRGTYACMTNSLATLRPDLAAEWHSSLNDTLTPDSFTVGSKTKVWWRCVHDDDHPPWEASIKSRSKGTRCPVCRHSKGEMAVRNWCKEERFLYKEQCTFIGCFNKALLKFDFFLPEFQVCVEYDGVQHVKGWEGDAQSLVDIQLRDSIKDRYCATNGIKIVRIAHTVPFKDIPSLLRTEIIESRAQVLNVKSAAVG